MITETSVNGIRTVLAPRPGPVEAGLLFRVGVADETLPVRGITHLVEHLALYRHGLSDLHYNGATASTYTHFHVTGTPAEVVEYLNGVCTALRDLPMERLETEKEILRTEAASRNHGPAHSMALWRYGARSYGLTGYEETGLPALTAPAVRAWAEEWFTGENAVLWMTGDSVPEGLDLKLPSGTRRPAPAPTSALPQTPAHFVGEDGAVVLTSVLPRSTEANLFTGVLGKELFRELRQKGGYSYAAAADYSPRDADWAVVTAYADALPQKQDAAVGAFIDVLAKLRAGRIEPADLESVRASALAGFDRPDRDACALPGHALDLLLGHPTATEEQLRAEIEAVTAGDLREVARDLWANTLMQVPRRGVDWAGLAEAPTRSADVVSGPRYSSVEDPAHKVVIGTDGVSLIGPSRQATVRYAECALLLSFPDGARRLVGHDGFSVAVEPTLYAVGADRLAVIDAAVPPEVVVPMPPRDPDRIPRPRPGAGAGVTAAGRARRQEPVDDHVWPLWVLIVSTTVMTLIALLLTLGELASETPTADGPGFTFLVIPWGLVLLCALPLGRRLRERRRSRRR
ncbi:insulinase family protein [Streptomyces sp. NPDC002054]|uniref:insulinase family protein n=1 Tax=Streptomyces sp. NPDC002054 TaxID=3154663 RepID=UPI00332B4913